MALTFAEKQKWVASLEAAVKCATKGEAFRKSVRHLHSTIFDNYSKDVNKVTFLITGLL